MPRRDAAARPRRRGARSRSAPATPCPRSAHVADVARDDARFSFYDRGPYRPSIPRPGVAARLSDRRGEHAVRGAGAHAARHRRRGEGPRARRGVHDDVRAAARCGCTSCRRRRTSRGSTTSARDLDRLADPRGGTRRRARRDRRAHAGGGLDLGLGAWQRVAGLRDVHPAALPARGERGAGDARGAAQHDRHHQPELQPGRARALHRLVQLRQRRRRPIRARRSTTSRGACTGGSITTAST